jgi:hypothetical protein
MALDIATNPETGEKVALVNGAWVPVATNDKGEYAYLSGGKWVIDGAQDEEDKSPARPQLTPEQIQEHAQKAFKSSARAESPIAAGMMDLTGGMTSLMRDATRLVSPEAADYGFPNRYVDKDSGLYLTGQVADPIGLLIGGGTMKGAQTLKALPKIGRAFASPISQGIVGGGAGGAAVGALSENGGAIEGGLFGAGVGGLLPVLARGAGYSWDRLSGKTPGLRAKEVIGKAYGDDLPSARTSWQQADPTLTATQAAASTGSRTGSALGERAVQNQSKPFGIIAQNQEDAQRALVAGVAGGDTQVAARQAQKQAKTALNAATTPMREGALEGANIGGEVSKRIQPQISAIDDQIQKVMSAQKAADAEALKFGGVASDNSAKVIAKLNAQKDFLQRQMDSMNSYGIQPLDTTTVSKGLFSKINDPKLAENSLSKKSLEAVERGINKWTKENGGIIDAEALYSIRKNAVQSVVQQQLAGASPKAQAKAVAGVLGNIEPMIDDAIIAAGGSGWKNYLGTYANGMKTINQLELGAKALKMFNKSPKQFMDLVENNSPEVVQKIFKSESDVVMAMAQGYQPLKKVGDALRRDSDLALRAAEGKTELANILRDKAAKSWMPKLINWKLALAREAGDVLEDQLNSATMNKVYTAMQSGKNAEEIMNMVPAKDRIAFLNILYTGRGTPVAVSGAQTVEGEQE